MLVGNSGLTGRIIKCAVEVHRVLGPGLLESAYRQCLAKELELAGISFKMEEPIPVDYKGLRLERGYQADFIVDGQVIIELKAVTNTTEVHKA